MADHRQTDDLDSRIASARAAEQARTGGTGPTPAKGYSQGSRILADLIGMPLGGALIGMLLDRWFGTGHWLMLVLLVLAFIGAGRDVYKISQERPE